MDPVTEANYAVSIAEFVLNKCAHERKVDIINSEIDRVKEFIKYKNVEAKEIGILTKLLSECAYPLKDRHDIIEPYFGRLLKEAVCRGYVSLVGELLHLRDTVKGELVKDVDSDGKTLLHYAAGWERSEDSYEDTVSIRLFAAYGEYFVKDFIKNVDKDKRSVLHLASISGRADFCKFVVEKYDLDMDAVDSWKENIFHYAAKGKDGYLIVDELGYPFYNLLVCENKTGLTPLHQAAQHDNTLVVKSLIQTLRPKLEYAIKATDNLGRTPLHLAAWKGSAETVREFLEAGSDPLIQDINGKTALHFAVKNTKPKEISKNVLEALLDSGSKEKIALLLWISAAGIGTADETEVVDPDVKNYLIQRKKEISKDVNVLRAATISGNSRLAWEFLNRGDHIGELCKKPELHWVTKKMENLSEQETDLATINDSLGRGALVENIAARFLNPYIISPVTVSISGEGGSGKTSLMLQIEAHLLTTAAQLAFPYLWNTDHFNGAKDTTLSKKGKKMCRSIEKGVANLLRKDDNSNFKRIYSKYSPDVVLKISLVNLLNNYIPEYKDVYQALACMDFNQLLKKKDSVYKIHGQSLGAVPRILTVNFNAGNYRGSNEAWAGLAIEITKELEESMTTAQLLTTRWRNSWKRHSEEFYTNFICPVLLLAVLAGWMGCATWKMLDSLGTTEMKGLKYGSIPSTIIVMLWPLLRAMNPVFKLVSTQMRGYLSKPYHSQQLGYQQKVIDDIKFMKEEIGKEPSFIFSFLAGEKTNNWWGLRKEDKIKGTNIPKYGSAPQDKLRIVAFVDDLDHCEDEAILKVLWGINLISTDCNINIILTMDKNIITKALQSQNKDVDRYISKLVQLPVSLPYPTEVESDSDAIEDGEKLEEEESKNFIVHRDHEVNMQEQSTERGAALLTSDDIESGNIQREWFLYEWLMHLRKGISSWLISWINNETPPEKTVKSPQLIRRFRNLRETLVLLDFTKKEAKLFRELKSYATASQKLPRQWKSYLNYYKFARNVAISTNRNAKIPLTVGWEADLQVWTFVCSQWKREMNILIQEGYIVEGADQPSLKDIVAKYIEKLEKERRGEEQEQERRTRVEETVQRWKKLKKALEDVRDVSMEGIQRFQHFRFHCDARNIHTGHYAPAHD